MLQQCVLQVYEQFKPLLNLQEHEFSMIGRTIPIPKFEEQMLKNLMNEEIKHLKEQSALIYLRSPIYVIGDIHGNIYDLLRVFIFAKPPPASRFLFLGDYVDRGQYSMEVLALLFCLQLAYPEHIYLIRGNHEFEGVNSFYGFQSEINSQYGNSTLYDIANTVFGWLPIAAKVNEDIFCVHGGLSPNLTKMKMFNQVKRPMKSYEKTFVADLVWSDPSSESSQYVHSQRGTGVTYGSEAIEEFCENFHINKIIRAHQCVLQGISLFNGNVYTVFSCSNYADGGENRCGIIFINLSGEIQSFSLPPITQIERSKCKIKRVTIESLKPPKTTIPFTIHNKLIDMRRNSQFSKVPPHIVKTDKYFTKSKSSSNTSRLPILSDDEQYDFLLDSCVSI